MVGIPFHKKQCNFHKTMETVERSMVARAQGGDRSEEGMTRWNARELGH
jgi:hypothetical protein